MGESIDCQLLVAFALPPGDDVSGVPKGGNPCCLMMLSAPPGVNAGMPAAHTLCESWLDEGNERPAVAVRCHTPSGELIECCGHGLLAAAHGWHRRLGCDRLTLLMQGSRVDSRRRGDYTWLRFASVATRPCPVPDWVPSVFSGRQPEAAATCGGERGYLVLQWPDNLDLYDLKPAIGRIESYTQRALVCTAAQPGKGDGAIQLRYFAPQYGVDEDDATGSAMRVLAAYWSPRFGRLTARQRSPGGGELLSNWSADHIDVGGRCGKIAVATDDA
jgi:predicted PhzF superfamily epimerase YddE/YHI9